MGHRSRSEIVSQILQAAIGGSATNTKIMYTACLNYNQLKEYLTILIENDLLSYDGDTQTFKTTEKGHMFLQAYSQIDQMLKEQQI
jgi:predicted transcriptional regulator